MQVFKEDVELNKISKEDDWGDSVIIHNALFGANEQFRLVNTETFVLSNGHKAWVETFLPNSRENYAIPKFKIISINKLHNNIPYIHRIYYYPDSNSDRRFVCWIDTESYNDIKTLFKDKTNLNLRSPMVSADVKYMKDNGLDVDEDLLKGKGILKESLKKHLQEDIEFQGHESFEDMNTMIFLNVLGLWKHNFKYEGTKVFELSSGHKAYVEEFRDDCSLFKLITILNCKVYHSLMERDIILPYNHRIYYYPIYLDNCPDERDYFWCAIDKESYNDIKNIFEDTHNIELRCLDKSDDSTIRKLRKFGADISKKDLKDENPVVIYPESEKKSDKPVKKYDLATLEKEPLDESVSVYQYFRERKHSISRLTEEQFNHWKLLKKWVKDNYTDVKFLKDKETKEENCEITCKKGNKDISFYYDGLDGLAYITIGKNDKVPESFKELMRSFHWWDTGDSWIEDDDETKRTYCFTNGNRFDESVDKLEISKEFKSELKKACENVDSENPDYAYVEKTLNTLWDIWEKSSYYDVLVNSLKDKDVLLERFFRTFDKDEKDFDDYVDCIKEDISVGYLINWAKKNKIFDVPFWGAIDSYFKSDSKFLTKRPNFKKFYDSCRERVKQILFWDYEKKESNAISVSFDEAVEDTDKDILLGLLDRIYALWMEYLDSLDKIDKDRLPPKSELDSELYWKLRQWGIDLKHYDLVCDYFKARGFEKEKKSFSVESFRNKISKD